jgi:hypothetical protein
LKVGDPELLPKHLHAKTQNLNESFSDVIWNRVGRNVFVAFDTSSLVVCDAVVTFNDGSVDCVRVLQQLGINPEINMINICQISNRCRKKSELDAEAISKEARKV